MQRHEQQQEVRWVARILALLPLLLSCRCPALLLLQLSMQRRSPQQACASTDTAAFQSPLHRRSILLLPFRMSLQERALELINRDGPVHRRALHRLDCLKWQKPRRRRLRSPLKLKLTAMRELVWMHDQ